MGGLIQTKGTQRLAKLFNNRFDTGSIPQTRAVENSSGTLLKTAFATLPDLRTISDNFIAQNANSNNAKWVPQVRDVLYPAATLVAVTVAGNDITFKNPAGGWPPLIAISATITAADLDRPGGVQKGATVTNVTNASPVPAGHTKVTFSLAVTAQAGDRISFCPLKHQNLVRRWRYYLGTELDPSNNTQIQSAVLTALTDPSVTSASFQAVENTTQKVFVETIFSTTGPEDENLDTTHKRLFIALMTARMNPPDPIDDP
jgi:hypothetical protein